MAMSDEMSDTYVHGGCCWRCGLQSNVRGLAVSEVIYQGGDTHSRPVQREPRHQAGAAQETRNGYEEAGVRQRTL